MKHFSEPKSFYKMLIPMLIICASFFLIGLLSNQYSKKVLTEKVMEQMDTKVTVWKDNLEQQVDSLLLIQSNLIHGDEIAEFDMIWGSMSPYERYERIIQLSDRLNEIGILHSNVSSIKVYFSNLKIVVSGNNPIKDIYEADNFFDYKQIYVDKNSGIYLTNYSPSIKPETSEQKVNYYIRSYIPNSKLMDSLVKDLPKEEGMLLLLDGNGEIISRYVNDMQYFGESRGMIEKLSDRIRRNGKKDFRVTGNDFATCIYSEDMNLYLAYVYPGDMIQKPLSFFMMLNAILAGCVLAFLIIYIKYASVILAKPINRIMEAMGETNESFLIQDKNQDEFSIIYARYNQMINRTQNLMEEKMQAQYQTKMAELQQLQYQIQPHFLYNSIFTVYRMAKLDENEEIAEYTEQLGQYYRYITKSTDKIVTVEQELAHLKNYLYIQGIRFGNRITVQIDDFSPEALEYPIAPILLQPMVENAFEHGLKDVLSDGWLHIAGWVKDGVFCFRVEDNGSGLSENKIQKLNEQIHRDKIGSEEIHGLTNINTRVRALYGGISGLRIENRRGGGLRVTLKIKGEV
ncbi:sensor histidine kinase [Novisyntrophococcus fermenticellae]|uniref:sensor histidine kinase n=1 Tax=Novisyntrophococcus fermenticellae TaxID=2068655 RepID=UPI001E3BE3F5|nr:histidine kinase [Novisyntrophococcus fermenticellae]